MIIKNVMTSLPLALLALRMDAALRKERIFVQNSLDILLGNLMLLQMETW